MKRTLIVGYGSQGRSWALNLKDNGFDLSVYLDPKSKKIKLLKEDNIRLAVDLKNEIKKSDIIVLLIPDSKQLEFYKNYLHENMKKKSALVFAHGYSIHYKQIVPRKDIDVVLIAPSTQGKAVRAFYKTGFACFISVHQDASGYAWQIAKNYAKAIGAKPAIKTTFKEETEIDLFAEQTVVCGGLHALIKTSFEILIENGYSPEIAYFSCLKEVLPLAQLISDEGIDGMYKNISDTAKYGGWTRGEEISEQIRPLLQRILKDIQSGRFKDEKRDTNFHEIPEEFSKHMINTLHKTFQKKGK